jgi:hypothetical protein
MAPQDLEEVVTGGLALLATQRAILPSADDAVLQQDVEQFHVGRRGNAGDQDDTGGNR